LRSYLEQVKAERISFATEGMIASIHSQRKMLYKVLENCSLDYSDLLDNYDMLRSNFLSNSAWNQK